MTPLFVLTSLVRLRAEWGKTPGVPVPVMLRSKIFAFLGQLAKATEAVEQVHAFAVQARDARTSADRRAALDALERAALALGGTP
ncbi:tetratricopeptide repeat domain protein [Deinococcus grandis]|uniref:Tetratricopeptide repeat domain protein n=1 Tax=Deinococcus grandis TaxID=57498 RepID=A0A100HHE0_9DEIO|nr:hypothetical protein [Deinococcus grandis]BBN95721.1 hypothetical protein DEGR_24540 [Deinococcus grandis]GAQ20793.1 tetratricopeptide repeat domain protein [Deinococcus grandis]